MVGCEMWPTKPYAGKSSTITDFLDVLQTTWTQKRAGFGKDAAELSPLMDEALIIWQDAIDQYSIQREDSTRKMLMTVLGLKQK